MSYYSQNPHFAPTDFSEDRERLEHAEELAGRWFADATKEQTATFNRRMAVFAPYKGAPKWERFRASAQREFAKDTAAARELSDITVRELMLTREVSEALSYRWDELKVSAAMLEAAE